MDNRIRGPRDKHPSGRPIRPRPQREWPYRLPHEDGPRILSLRKDWQTTTAIGFTADLGAEEDDND